MIKLSRAILCISVFSLGLISTANANLEARAGGMVYDTDLNITWLSDANYAQTSGYDADGRMNWNEANTWAESLNVGGVSGWRLPTADWCLGLSCPKSEMGHLFYNELGGTEFNSILSSSDPDLALFTNIQQVYLFDEYWSGTTDYIHMDYQNAVAFAFRFFDGFPDEAYKSYNFSAWAVHDGDVAAIPEPETYAMMVLGLAVLFGFGRLREQS